MLNVLVAIEVVKCLAKDMHYRSNHEWFYALHLLADKVDFGSAEDDIKEAYFLGQRATVPPSEGEIKKLVAERIREVPVDNNGLILRLANACDMLLYSIEEAKRERGMFAGIHAILDGISQTALTIKGLCWRTLNNGKTGNENAN